jgi:hypothetical protein
MKIATPKQLQEFAATVCPAAPSWQAQAVADALQLLADALQGGLVLNSGDGFYYRMDAQRGRLVAHDGSMLNGTLLTQLQTYVWQRGQLVEVVDALDNLGCIPSTAKGYRKDYDAPVVLREVRNELQCMGLAQ